MWPRRRCLKPQRMWVNVLRILLYHILYHCICLPTWFRVRLNFNCIDWEREHFKIRIRHLRSDGTICWNSYATKPSGHRIYVGQDVAEEIELMVTDLSVTLVLVPWSNLVDLQCRCSLASKFTMFDVPQPEQIHGAEAPAKPRRRVKQLPLISMMRKSGTPLHLEQWIGLDKTAESSSVSCLEPICTTKAMCMQMKLGIEPVVEEGSVKHLCPCPPQHSAAPFEVRGWQPKGCGKTSKEEDLSDEKMQQLHTCGCTDKRQCWEGWTQHAMCYVC